MSPPQLASSKGVCVSVKDRGSVANGFVTLQWRWSAGSVLVMKRIQTGLNDTCCVCLLYLSLDS